MTLLILLSILVLVKFFSLRGGKFFLYRSRCLNRNIFFKNFNTIFLKKYCKL